MKLQELMEGVSDYVYHVTPSKYVPSIKKKGLLPIAPHGTTNWTKRDGDRYQKDPSVFAFRDPEDAYRWAFKHNWDHKEDVAIVKIKNTDQWHRDPSEDIHLQMGKGEALRSMDRVPPEDVVGSVEFADFKNPMELDMKQDEYMQHVVKMITES
jgi:hypothetical protein